VADGEGLILAALAVGGGLLALKLLSDKETPPPPPAPIIVMPAAPQERPGPADSGESFVVRTMPPEMTTRDVATWYARKGRAHDASAFLTHARKGGPSFHGEMEPEGRTRRRSRRNTEETPVSSTTVSSGVPKDGSVPTQPAKPAPQGTPQTHEDIFGRVQPGPPSDLETMAKPVFTIGGGAVMEAVGITQGLAVQAASGAKTVGQLRAAGGLAGPAAAGVGLGLQVTQTLKDVGFFENVVKPAGIATGQALGPDLSKAVATLALPLSVPGAVIHSLVSPGESIVGNINRAATASFIPETVKAGDDALKAAGNAIGQFGSAVGSAISNLFSGKWF